MNKFFLALCASAVTVSSAIHLNQVGFYPNGKKVAIFTDTTLTEFTLQNSASGETAFSGTLSKPAQYTPASEYTVVAEFTDFRTPGSYRLFAGNDSSALFAIRENVLSDALKINLRSFYYSRCSVALDSLHAGYWAREAGHPDTAMEVIDADSATTYPPVNAPGGWYDAGDYGKYIVNAGITTGTMLGLYELCPDIVGDDLNIPESGNNKSDLLDEIKFQLGWMLAMQDDDGGVFFKVGPISWPGGVAPVNDKGKRYVIGKSTTSTLNFAAVLAMAGRIYKQYDSVFAAGCLAHALDAWKWACDHRAVRSPTDTRGTGPYDDGGDLQFKDEFFWAAAELYLSSRDLTLRDTVVSMLKTRKFVGPAGWQYVSNLGFFSLAIHETGLGDSLNTAVRAAVVTFAEKTAARQNSSAYRTNMQADDFQWGSAGTVGTYATPYAYAYHLTNDQKYLDALVLASDFILGKNPTGYTFITGIGSKSPLNPHHRPSQGDKVDEPVPGLVVGGPNRNANGADAALTKIINAGTPAAKCYTDVAASYASNESAINQNAPWVLIWGFLEQHADKGLSSGIRRPFAHAGKRERSFLQTVPIAKGLNIICRIPPATVNATVTVHNIAGRLVASFDAGNTAATQKFTVSNSVNASVLVVRLVAGDYSLCKSVVTVR